MKSNLIPLFPLKSIVLPGGIFRLRIFERRYIDMIKNCIKDEIGFCITLTRSEPRDSYITDIYNYGCYVKIIDWNQLEDGLLGITVEGINKVHVLECDLNKNNLLIGSIEKIDLEKTLIIFTADHGADSASWTPEMEKFAQDNIENRKVEPGLVANIATKVPKSLIPFRKTLSDKYREKRDQTIEKKMQPERKKVDDLNLGSYEKRIIENAVGSIPRVYEEMCHVPLIISGFKLPNKIIEELVSSIDIFPTIAEIVDMPKKNTKIHGRSLLPVINGKKIEERAPKII